MKESGDVIEVTEVPQRHFADSGIVRISKDEYIRLSDETGEIHQFEHKAKSRLDNERSLRRTFSRIRDLVNANATDTEKILWMTLTYAENMQDTKRLYEDFKKFIRRFRRKWGECEYLAVAEPQQRGAWHMHVLVFFGSKRPWIVNSDLRKCWGQGFVNVRSVQNVDNVGAYLSAYLGDVEVPLDDKTSGSVVKTMKDGTKKRYVKGGRLALYPPGMNIYRRSRGLKEPEERWVNETELESLVSDLEPTFSKIYDFETEQGFRVRCKKTFYNKRKHINKTSG